MYPRDFHRWSDFFKCTRLTAKHPPETGRFHSTTCAMDYESFGCSLCLPAGLAGGTAERTCFNTRMTEKGLRANTKCKHPCERPFSSTHIVCKASLKSPTYCGTGLHRNDHSLLFGGKNIRNDKFKRVKPIYHRARKSGASSSSAPLPLDATEPRLELELASADNLMAVA